MSKKIIVNAENPAGIIMDLTPEEEILKEASDAQAVIEKAEFNALAWKRNREQSYPLLKEFAEAYCEKEIGGNSAKWDAYVTKYNLVRSNNPKP